MGSAGRTQSTSALLRQAISARIVIGVAGHHKLENQPALAQAVRSAIQSINQKLPPTRSTPVGLCVLSPLAEGADSLVAKEVLKVPGAMLEVVLPLEKDDYMRDFQTKESNEEFEGLLSQAESIKVLPLRFSRTEVYGQAGYYMVDHYYLRGAWCFQTMKMRD